MQLNDFFEIGYISKTHGLKGEVQILFSESPEKLILENLFLDYNGKLIPHFVLSYKISQKNIGYFLFEDIDHVDKASKIIKRLVFLPNKLKPKIKKNDFSFSDLKGFTAIDTKHGLIGEIVQVQEFPKQFIATVIYQEREILFPVADDFILTIDIDKKTISVNLPDGLIDIYLNS